MPRPESTALYRRYETEIEQWSDVGFVGRLATYKHHNMDQAVREVLAMAMAMAKRLLDPCAV